MILKDKLKGCRLILASHSPRRRELMAGAGFEFTVADGYDVEELYPAELPLGEVAEYLSNLKSEAYPAPLREGEILITADTVVLCEGELLGKPAGRAAAVEMLGKLSGRRHTVVTGVTIRDIRRRESFSVATDVWFRTLRAEEIEYYVDSCKPFDKAGAYGIQEWIGYAAIERIEGSFYNVMGLPIQALYVHLEEFVSEI